MVGKPIDVRRHMKVATALRIATCPVQTVEDGVDHDIGAGEPEFGQHTLDLLSRITDQNAAGYVFIGRRGLPDHEHLRPCHSDGRGNNSAARTGETAGGSRDRPAEGPAQSWY